MITKITVRGAPAEEETGAMYPDLVWHRVWVDDEIRIQELKLTIRRWLHSGHPLTVYINGCVPLYPTIVYDQHGTLLGMSAGLLKTAGEK